MVYLDGINAGSFSGELDLALSLIATHFQAFEFYFHEAVGLGHELGTIDPHIQLFQMMIDQTDDITVTGDGIRTLLVLYS